MNKNFRGVKGVQSRQFLSWVIEGVRRREFMPRGVKCENLLPRGAIGKKRQKKVALFIQKTSMKIQRYLKVPQVTFFHQRRQETKKDTSRRLVFQISFYSGLNNGAAL